MAELGVDERREAHLSPWGGDERVARVERASLRAQESRPPGQRSFRERNDLGGGLEHGLTLVVALLAKELPGCAGRSGPLPEERDSYHPRMIAAVPTPEPA
jgi:hypothetical protein